MDPEHGLLSSSPRSGNKKSKGSGGKEGKTAGVAATGGVQFGTPFGRAHFASAKVPGLLLTDVQMIDALRRCKAKSWYSAAPFTGDNKLPNGDGAADFARLVDKVATLSSYGADPVRFALGASVHGDPGLKAFQTLDALAGQRLQLARLAKKTWRPDLLRLLEQRMRADHGRSDLQVLRGSGVTARLAATATPLALLLATSTELIVENGPSSHVNR